MTQRFKLLLVSFCLVTVFAMGVYWYRLESSHDQMRADTLNHLARASQQLANGVSEQMAAVVRGVDLGLQRLRGDYEVGRPAFERSIRTIYNAFPADSLLHVGVIDTHGYLTYSNEGSPRIYLGDREHFRFHAEHPDQDRLFVSSPVMGRVSKAWSIQFSRPIRHEGQFVGVLVISVSPFYLSRTLEHLGLGPNDSATLLLADGTYLARSSNIEGFVGKKVKASRTFLTDGSETGGFRDMSTFDNTWRTFSWHRLAKVPLLVVVGLSEPDALTAVDKAVASSRRANLVGSALVLGFMAAIVMLLIRVERQKQRLASNEALYRSLFEKNASVKLLIDSASGQIVAANQAACDFYGYPRNALESMNIADINCLPPAAVKAEVAKAATEQRAHFLFSHRLASGEIRQVEVYSGPLELDGRHLLYSIIHDVTERSLLEKRLKESEASYRNIFEVIPDGMMLVNKHRDIVLWNQAALDILGVTEQGLKLREFTLNYRDGQAVPHDEYPSWRAISLPTSQGLYSIPQADGSKHWIAVSTRQLPKDADGQPSGAVISFSDITRLVALEESLLISQSVFDAATEGIMVTDSENRVVRVNPAFTRITGYGLEDVQGKTPSFWAAGHHDETFYQAMYQSLSEKGRWEGEIINRRKDGEIFVEWLKISAVKDREGLLLRHVALLSDITVKKQQEQDIWHRAHYDPLTELPNRTLFMDRLGQALTQATRREQAVGVLFIDLDNFKPVNDTYGHQAGDELLRQTAKRIAHCLREEDTVARLGGDEFVAMLPAIVDAADCSKVANKILDSLSLPFRIGDVIVEISASIGTSFSSKNGGDAEALVKQADQAMYRAKANGRHTVRQFSV